MVMMHALLVDTTGNRLSLSLSDDSIIISRQSFEAGTTTSERLLPSLELLLQSVALSAHDIDRLHVVVGPGSFTGIRVGISTVQGIAAGIHAPVSGVASLDAAALVSGRQQVVVGARLRGREYAMRQYDLAAGTWSDIRVADRSELGSDPLVINSKGDEANVSLDLSVAVVHPLFPRFALPAEPLYLRRSEAELNHDSKSA